MSAARKLSHVLYVVALVIGALIPLQATPAYASTIQVTTLEDELNSDGDCSLREAIESANTNVVVDVCAAGDAAPTVDVIGFSVGGTITLGSTLPAIWEAVTIEGPGVSNLAISGGGTVRILEVSPGGTLNLVGATIADGAGGGIYSRGTLTVTDSTFSANSVSGDGGAINNYGGNAALAVTDSTFSGNSATGSGGAISGYYGTITVTDSTFSNNFANSGGGAISGYYTTLTVADSAFTENSAIGGGAIASDALTITNSTFSGNTASTAGAITNYGTASITNGAFSANRAYNGGGGAITNYGTATIANSTFSGNSALLGGGAIGSSNAVLTVTNSTFSGNFTDYASGDTIYSYSSDSGAVTVQNTILANTVAPRGNCSGVIIDGGGNLQLPGYDCGETITSADPLLDTAGLQDNGGATETIALQPGSPAIDAAVAENCPATDQRGVERPQGAGCDIGAFELEAAPWFQLEASVYGRWIHGQEWQGDLAQGDSARVVVTDVDGTTVLLDVTTTVVDEGFRRSFEVDPGFDLQPGMTITATASEITKTLPLVHLTIDSIDRDTGVVTGTASPDIAADSILHVDTDISPDGSGNYISAWPGTDGNGNWTVDFGQALVPGNDTGADISDEDGDATIFDLMVPEPEIAPDTFITSGPHGTATDDTPTFAFDSSEPGATFECRIDLGTWSECTSAFTTEPLANGQHTFLVRATDAAGNTDPTPAVEPFTVLTTPGQILGWGWNSYGQADPPPGSDYIAIAAGQYHGLALTTGGSIVGWGFDGDGRASLPPGTYVAIASGNYHSLALRADGSIVGAGYNSDGQASPPAGNDYVAIDGGSGLSLALRSDGSIVGWGINYGGAANPPAGHDYVAIAAGDGDHALALRNDGSIVGWGDNTYGQLNAPAGNDYVAIAAGIHFGIALRADGSIVGWGDNSYGQLNLPPGDDYVAISAAGVHSLALRADGSIVAWGTNPYGPLTPPPGDDFVAISTYYQGLAISTDTTAPETTIDSGPQGLTNDNDPAFTFSADEAGATFECALDGGGYVSCISPMAYTDVADGSHTFEVRATDAAGNTDPTPASRGFTIDTDPPETTIVSGPTDPTDDPTPTFEFSSDEPGSLECRMDTGPWEDDCTSPFTAPTLVDGLHAFEVRATDLAGNTDPTPASLPFTVQTTATTVLHPSGVVVTAGSWIGGTATALTSDDDVYLLVRSTKAGTRTASWYGTFTGVDNAATHLEVAYTGKTSAATTQTIWIWRWSDSTWVQLDSRPVSTTEVQVSGLVPPGNLADYVSGIGGVGNVAVRVTATSTAAQFTLSGDLLELTVEL
jgi:CSLREA domain-containing protein